MPVSGHPLPPIVVHNFGARSLLRKHDAIATFDCHAGNLFLGAGQNLPINVIFVRASDHLQNVLAATH